VSTVGHNADDAYGTLDDTALVDARTVDGAAGKLRELRRDEREGFGVAAAAVALALAATELRPDLAMPLFLGGLARRPSEREAQERTALPRRDTDRLVARRAR